jgi:hypothetical protein
VLAAGCSSGGSEATPAASPAASSAAATTPGGPPDPHAAFDPCKDITDAWLTREGFALRREPTNTTNNDIVSTGCVFVMIDGYGVGILTARNQSLDRIRARKVPKLVEFKAGSRAALSYDTLGFNGACEASIEMKGGALDLVLSGANTGGLTYDKDPCVLVRDLAIRVSALLPTGS